jgi:hypothetical protein
MGFHGTGKFLRHVTITKYISDASSYKLLQDIPYDYWLLRTKSLFNLFCNKRLQKNQIRGFFLAKKCPMGPSEAMRKMSKNIDFL